MCGQYKGEPEKQDTSWENEGGAGVAPAGGFAKQPGLARAVAPFLLFMVDYLRPFAEAPTVESNVVATKAANLAKLAFGPEAVEDRAARAMLAGGGNVEFLNIIEDFANEAVAGISPSGY